MKGKVFDCYSGVRQYAMLVPPRSGPTQGELWLRTASGHCSHLTGTHRVLGGSLMRRSETIINI